MVKKLKEKKKMQIVMGTGRVILLPDNTVRGKQGSITKEFENFHSQLLCSSFSSYATKDNDIYAVELLKG